jgi:cation transport ATPase
MRPLTEVGLRRSIRNIGNHRILDIDPDPREIDATEIQMSTQQPPQAADRRNNTPSDADLSHPHTIRAFRNIQRLIWAYLAIGILALGAIVLMRHDSAEVNSAVWTRAMVVVITAVLLVIFAARAARGARWAFRRLRLVSIITPVAIAAIIALPGTFPLWMKIEQGICGLVMIGVATVANGRHLRQLFARQAG